MRFRGKGERRSRQGDGDFFRDSAKERRATEDEVPWFLADDDPSSAALDVEAGRSARIEDDPDLSR
jgi:hypothetical protein